MATETTKANTLIDADGLQTALEKVNDSCTRIKYVQGAPELPAATASRLNRIFVSDLTGAGTTTAEYAAYITVQTADGYAWMELNRKPDLSGYVTQPGLLSTLTRWGQSYVTTAALNTTLDGYATKDSLATINGNNLNDGGDIGLLPYTIFALGFDMLPTASEQTMNRLYLLPYEGDGIAPPHNRYVCYITIKETKQGVDYYSWEELGSYHNLLNYVTQDDLTSSLSGYVTTTALNTALDGYATTEYVTNAIDSAVGDISAALDTINGE